MIFKKIRIVLLLLVLCFTSFTFSQNVRYSDTFDLSQLRKGQDYLPDKIILKLKPQFSDVFTNKNSSYYTAINSNIKRVDKMFPTKTPLEKSTNQFGQELVDLSLIYVAEINPAEDIAQKIDALFNLGCFSYAEPYYIPQTLYTPNDPLVSQQYYLNNIKAFDAWNITKGDTNIVIGIVDTGTDLQHPDLTHNIKYNYDDPINGYDTDNDGFVDNFYGWDLGENNNSPQYNPSVPMGAHGIHVSGIAAASTDNSVGISGVGFYTKFLPVKVTNEDGLMTHAYQGIVYAADKGSKIINCSWGMPGGVGQFGQDIVNYATYNKNALVVAASGNTGAQHYFYPASYQNAVSVSATNIYDHKWPESTYNRRVDVMAPGHQIQSTWVNGSYSSSSGTSLAAPIVSGAAALLAAHYPHYLPIQLTAQLKATADFLDTIPANMVFAGMLGTGRLNIYRALTETHHAYVRMVSRNLTAEQFGTYTIGDTVYISGDFVNYLAPTTALSCTLRALSNYVTVIDSVVNFSQPINTLDTVNNTSSPFSIRINPNMPVSARIDFEIHFDDVNYKGKQHFFELFNVDYLTLDTNRIKTTLTSKSRIGYNTPDKTQGLGMIYNNSGTTLLSFGGLLMGISPTKIVDNIYGSVEGSFNNHFAGLSNIKRIANPTFSDFHAQAVFNDSLAGNQMMNIEVINNYYAWINPPNDKYYITEYLIVNHNDSSLANFYAGLFMDWRIPDARYHRADYNSNLKMGYAYSTLGENYTATKLLTSGNYRFYAFDNLSGIKIKDGFTNNEKYNALRSSRNSAGLTDINNDIATLLSSGPHTISAGDTLRIAYAVIVGDHLNDITNSANAAQIRYDNEDLSVRDIFNNNRLHIYPNPAQTSFTILFDIEKPQELTWEVYNTYGQLILSGTDYYISGTNEITVSTESLSKGLYIVKINGINFSQKGKILIK